MLKDVIEEEDKKNSTVKIIEKYQKELIQLNKHDNEVKDAFGMINTWWVFSEVAKKANYQKIFLAEVENIGYKRTKRGIRARPNELFRTNKMGEVLVDDGEMETSLDYLRKVKWD